MMLLTMVEQVLEGVLTKMNFLKRHAFVMHNIDTCFFLFFYAIFVKTAMHLNTQDTVR
jgi:hypothetical protein